jgi:hypothetical protein
MPLYLSKFSYTPETWARLIETLDALRKVEQVQYRAPGA